MKGFSHLTAMGMLVVGGWVFGGCSDAPADLASATPEETLAAAPRAFSLPHQPKRDPVQTETRLTEGTVAFGPQTVRLLLDRKNALPVTAALEGDWTGKGVRITRTSGVVIEAIRFDAFDGVLTLKHAIEGVPSPLAIGFRAERGSVQSRSVPNPDGTSRTVLDFHAQMKNLTLTDPATGAELPWPEEVFGPLPNVLHLRDDVLRLGMGKPTDEDADALEEADSSMCPRVRPGPFGRMR